MIRRKQLGERGGHHQTSTPPFPHQQVKLKGKKKMIQRKQVVLELLMALTLMLPMASYASGSIMVAEEQGHPFTEGEIEEVEIFNDGHLGERDSPEEKTEKERRTEFVLDDDLLARIHTKLQKLGSLAGNKDKIQEVAMKELLQWQQQEAANQHTRQILEEKRRSPPETLKAFPYELVPPPPPSADGVYSLDFVQAWTPPGGGRFAEYAMGFSPYLMTDELKQKSDDIARLRRPYIQQAMQFAWDGYREYAFGYDELRPQSKKGTNHWGNIAITLVDSLDTLWLMNKKDAFWEARDYVRDFLSHNQNRKVSVFETTIRSLGGLLSAYDLSKDSAFLEEALDLAHRLMKAFEQGPNGNTTILPMGEVNLQTGACNMIPWAGTYGLMFMNADLAVIST
jgi:hypothetical protein